MAAGNNGEVELPLGITAQWPHQARQRSFYTDALAMALLNLITFFIHAVVQAMAAMLGAVFKHLLPAVFIVALLGAAVAALCTSCGVGGVALLRRRRRNNS